LTQSCSELFRGGRVMPSTMKKQPNTKKPAGMKRNRVRHTARTENRISAASAIRRMGDELARHWNAGDFDGVAAVYAEDAVYLPPRGQTGGPREVSQCVEAHRGEMADCSRCLVERLAGFCLMRWLGGLMPLLHPPSLRWENMILWV